MHKHVRNHFTIILKALFGQSCYFWSMAWSLKWQRGINFELCEMIKFCLIILMILVALNYVCFAHLSFESMGLWNNVLRFVVKATMFQVSTRWMIDLLHSYIFKGEKVSEKENEGRNDNFSFPSEKWRANHFFLE